MVAVLTIQLKDPDDAEVILPKVTKMIAEGYTSGIDPTWSLKEVDK
jgi:hypothetical protein